MEKAVEALAAMARMEDDLRVAHSRSTELAKQDAEVAAKRREELDEHHRESVTLKGEVHELKR